MVDRQLIVLACIPIGVGLLYLLRNNETPTATAGKEVYYLSFNRDEIFKGLLATEGHFRNVQESGVDEKGFMNCAVKHLADVEGHADEAVSHSLVAETKETSEKFKQLRDDVQKVRHGIQFGTLSVSDGLVAVRNLRREFESFNPAFDVSKCKACEIQVA